MSDVLTQAAQAQKPETMVWRDDWSLPQAEQGLKVLGVPVGHPSFIAAQMTSKLKEQAKLFERIPLISKLDGCCFFLCCDKSQLLAPSRASRTHKRVCGGSRPECVAVSQQYFAGGGVAVPHTLCGFLAIDLGRFGCRWQFRHAAHWSSGKLWRSTEWHMRVVEESGTLLREMGVTIAPWEALAEGLRPETGDAEREPCQVSHGLRPSVTFTALPVHRVSKILRSFAAFICLCPSLFGWCGRPLDVFDDHRATCSTVGVLGRADMQRGRGVWDASRHRHHTFPQKRRTPLGSHCGGFDVVWCGQLALDATVVSPLHADDSHRRKADTTDGQALAEACKHKERTYAALCHGNGRAMVQTLELFSGLFHCRIGRFVCAGSGRVAIGWGPGAIGQ